MAKETTWMAIMMAGLTTAGAAQTPGGTTASLCPARSDQREAFALWSAAADRLRTMAVARADSGTIVHLLFDRNLGTNGRRIVRQSTRRVETDNAKPIRAERTPGELVTTGYVDSTSFHGPGPEVLADSRFATTHCLSIREERGEVGVAFVPIRGRDSIPEIAGVLWLSREPVALRSLTFEYRGVSRDVIAMRAGGRLDFETLPNGLTIIRSWQIRSPKVIQRRILQRVNGRTVLQEEPAMTEVHEIGGLIVGGRLSDGTVLAPPPLSSLGGRVRHALREEFISSAHVTLDSTDVHVSTDGAGRFLFESLLPGPYTVRVADSMVIMASNPNRYAQRNDVQQIVRRIRTIPVEAQVGRVPNLELRLPWRSPVNGCGPTPPTERPRFLMLGTLEATDSTSLSHARVRLSWIDSTGTSVLETRIEAIADAGSQVLMCGIPAGRELMVSALSTQGSEFLGRARVTSMGYDANNQPISGNLRLASISVVRTK